MRNIELSAAELNILLNALDELHGTQRRMATTVGLVDPEQVRRGMEMVMVLRAKLGVLALIETAQKPPEEGQHERT
jgi:hypothetical protein